MQLIRRQRGFTLVELMVTLVIGGILAALAVPSFKTWIANSKVRATTEQVMNQVKVAQSEAVKHYRRVVLYRADSSNCSSGAPTSSSTGNVWVVKTLPLYTGDATEVVQCGNLSDTATGVSITTGPTAVCFGTNGWPVAADAATTGIGAACTVNTIPINFNLNATGADRPLRVTLALAGGVRMCDPAKSLSTTNPDGC